MSKNAKTIILVLSLLIVGLVAFIITDKILDSVSQKNLAQVNQVAEQSSKNVITNSKSTSNSEKTKEEKKSESNNVNNKIEKDKKDPVTTSETEEQKESTKNNSKDNKKATTVEAIKKALKDESWRKENVMMKKTCFGGTPSKNSQKLSFMRVVGADYEPLIIVEAYSEDDLSSQAFMVYYKNGKVVSVPLTEDPIHIYHSAVGVDPNKAKMNIGYMHMGYEYNMMYDIKSGMKKYVQGTGSENTYENDEIIYEFYKYEGDINNKTVISESEYNEMNNAYDNYYFYEISTELTNSNIDKYVK
ncbi:MAG: hypothetical protein J6J36_00325 [Clostridia bacterium]|nr:hypothetical protein [Clostridia bacterium]